MLRVCMRAVKMHSMRTKSIPVHPCECPDRDVRQQRRVVDAFLTAVREGNFEDLVALLDPDICALASASRIVRGAKAVAGQAVGFSTLVSNQIVL